MAYQEPLVKAPTDKGNSRVISILDAAKDILVKEGFAALSYRNIAKNAGIAVGNVNYYYPSKDDLMTDLANFIFDRWGERFRRHIPKHLTDDEEIFLFSIGFMINENKRGRTMCLLMEMWAMSNRSVSVAKMLDAFYEKMRSWIAEMISRVKPDLDQQTCALRAALITAQIEGLMLLIGPKRPTRSELSGLEQAAVEQIQRLAFAD